MPHRHVANRHLFLDRRTGGDRAIEQPAIERAAGDRSAGHAAAILAPYAHPAGSRQQHAADRVAPFDQ